MKAIACLFLFTTVLNGVHGLDLNRRNKTDLFRRIISAECAEFGEVAHGTVSKINVTSVQGVHIECDEGYDLTGGPKVLCNDGRWDAAPRPMCAKRCKPPPLLRDGGVSIEGRQDGPNSYRHGTKAIYSCSEGFELSPRASQIRSCHDGVWTGLAATCVSNGCPPPPPVANGYHVLEPLSPAAVPVVPRTDDEGRVVVSVEQRAHYSCNVGFTLQGPASLQCLTSGQWNPRQPPKCVRQYGPPTEPPPPPPPPLPALDSDVDAERMTAREAAKGRWKNLRDFYSKCLKFMKGDTDSEKKYQNWPRACHLEFLNDTLSFRPTSSNVEEMAAALPDVTEREEDASRPPKVSPHLAISPKRKEISQDLPAVLSYLQEKECNKRPKLDHVGNLFLSYAHTFKKFSPRTQAILKMKLAQLFGEAELESFINLTRSTSLRSVVFMIHGTSINLI